MVLLMNETVKSATRKVLCKWQSRFVSLKSSWHSEYHHLFINYSDLRETARELNWWPSFLIWQNKRHCKLLRSVVLYVSSPCFRSYILIFSNDICHGRFFWPRKEINKIMLFLYYFTNVQFKIKIDRFLRLSFSIFFVSMLLFVN